MEESPIARLLRGEARVVNVGLPVFAEELRVAAVPVVELDWVPPPARDPRVQSLLAKLS